MSTEQKGRTRARRGHNIMPKGRAEDHSLATAYPLRLNALPQTSSNPAGAKGACPHFTDEKTETME